MVPVWCLFGACLAPVWCLFGLFGSCLVPVWRRFRKPGRFFSSKKIFPPEFQHALENLFSPCEHPLELLQCGSAPIPMHTGLHNCNDTNGIAYTGCVPPGLCATSKCALQTMPGLRRLGALTQPMKPGSTSALITQQPLSPLVWLLLYLKQAKLQTQMQHVWQYHFALGLVFLSR